MSDGSGRKMEGKINWVISFICTHWKTNGNEKPCWVEYYYSLAFFLGYQRNSEIDKYYA